MNNQTLKFLISHFSSPRLLVFGAQILIFLMSVQLGSISKSEMTESERAILHSGHLVSIKLIPKKKEIHLYVVGNEKLNIQFSELEMRGVLKTITGEKKLVFEKKKDYFSTPLERPEGDLKLQIRLSPTKEDNIDIHLR